MAAINSWMLECECTITERIEMCPWMQLHYQTINFTSKNITATRPRFIKERYAIACAQDTIRPHVLINSCAQDKCIYREPAQQTKCSAPVSISLLIAFY